MKETIDFQLPEDGDAIDGAKWTAFAIYFEQYITAMEATDTSSQRQRTYGGVLQFLRRERAVTDRIFLSCGYSSTRGSRRSAFRCRPRRLPGRLETKSGFVRQQPDPHLIGCLPTLRQSRIGLQISLFKNRRCQMVKLPKENRKK